MEWDKIIREKVKCCACEGSLNESMNMNVMGLLLIAEWPTPTAANVYFPGDPLQAIAILCDRCLAAGPRGKPGIKYAIQWTKDAEVVTYHPVEDLDPMPAEVIEKYRLLADLSDKDWMSSHILSAFSVQDSIKN